MSPHFKRLTSSLSVTHFLKILINWSGYLGAACMVVLVVVTIGDVLMRYFFKNGSVGLQELEWHLFSAVFLLAAAYTMKCDEHVRLDIVYQSSRFNENHRNRVNIFGTIIFLIPFCLIVIWYSIPFAFEAFVHAETSPDPGGLTNRWVIKALIPAAFLLMLLQSLNDLLARVRNRN